MKEKKIYQIIDENLDYTPDYGIIKNKVNVTPKSSKFSFKLFLSLGVTSFATVILLVVSVGIIYFSQIGHAKESGYADINNELVQESAADKGTKDEEGSSDESNKSSSEKYVATGVFNQQEINELFEVLNIDGSYLTTSSNAISLVYKDNSYCLIIDEQQIPVYLSEEPDVVFASENARIFKNDGEYCVGDSEENIVLQDIVEEGTE